MIGNLVHSSPNIKKDVLRAGALQPVIELLRYYQNSSFYSTSLYNSFSEGFNLFFAFVFYAAKIAFLLSATCP